MKQILAKAIILATCLAQATFAIAASEADAGGEATELSAMVGKIKTYQADFEQTVIDSAGQRVDFSAGFFAIQRPNHFRWEIKQEFPQLIVADGDHLWTYDQDLEQVTIQNQSKMLGDSPLLLLTSNAEQLSSAFNVEKMEVAEGSGKTLFRLTPTNVESLFDSVHILFKKGMIHELMMADTLGQQTMVKFANIRQNEKLNLSLFSFEMPEGVDIVDSRENVAAQ